MRRRRGKRRRKRRKRIGRVDKKVDRQRSQRAVDQWNHHQKLLAGKGSCGGGRSGCRRGGCGSSGSGCSSRFVFTGIQRRFVNRFVFFRFTR